MNGTILPIYICAQLKILFILPRIKNDLLKSGAFFASLSGSGSTMFGVYDKISLAKKAQKELTSYQTILTIPKVKSSPLYGA